MTVLDNNPRLLLHSQCVFFCAIVCSLPRRTLLKNRLNKVVKKQNHLKCLVFTQALLSGWHWCVFSLRNKGETFQTSAFVTELWRPVQISKVHWQIKVSKSKTLVSILLLCVLKWELGFHMALTIAINSFLQDLTAYSHYFLFFSLLTILPICHLIPSFSLCLAMAILHKSTLNLSSKENKKIKEQIQRSKTQY